MGERWRRVVPHRAPLLALLLATGCGSPASVGAPPQSGSVGGVPLPRPAVGTVAGAGAASGPAAGLHPSVAAGTPEAPPPASASAGADLWEAHRAELLALVNEDRRSAGVPPLPADPEAMRFAQAEAVRLVAEGAFGHHARDGSKPYQRWSREGGTAHVQENLFRLKVWNAEAHARFRPRAAHKRLMRSAGHRRNILDPAHTGVGIGVAHDPERNTVYVVQEFVNRYVSLAPAASRWKPGESRALRGWLPVGGGLEPSLAALHPEPPPGSVQAAHPARRAARRRWYREGEGEPALVLTREEFAFDARTGEFRLPIELPPDLEPGSYTFFLYLTKTVPPAPDGRRIATASFPAATLSWEVGP